MGTPKTLIFALMLIIAIVFLSGCTTPDFMSGSKCSDIGNCKDNTQAAEVTDVIVFESTAVMPTNIVRPGTEFEVRATIKDVDTDSQRHISIESFRIENQDSFECVDCEYKTIDGKKTFELFPGQIKAYNFRLKAPSREDSGSMSIPGNIGIAVTYKFTSESLTTITYTKRQTYIDYLNSQKTVPITRTESYSNGPVELKIDTSDIKDQPIIYETAQEYPRQIWLEITNKGQGMVDNIKKDSLTLEFSNNKGTFAGCSDEFGGEKCSTSSVKSTQDIRVLGQKSFRYYFFFKPGTLDLTSKEFDQATLKISADYTYKRVTYVEVKTSPKGSV